MPKLLAICPNCKKSAVEENSHFIIEKNPPLFPNSTRVSHLSCGCVISEELKDKAPERQEYILKDGKRLHPYQLEGKRFAELSNFRCLIGDEQGLGKTIEAVALIDEHYWDLVPILIVVKASLTVQWQRHLFKSAEKFAQIITTKDDIIPNLGIYITSYDTAHRIKQKLNKLNIRTIILDECQMIKNDEAQRTNGIREIVNRKELKVPIPLEAKEKTGKILRAEMIAWDLMKYHGISERFSLTTRKGMGKQLGLCVCRVEGEGIIKGEIQLSRTMIENSKEDFIIEIILHEIAHAITPGAGHLPIWKDTARSISATGDAVYNCTGSIEEVPVIEDSPVDHRIFLSGTPIKNNATEFFPALNLLRPEMFPSRQRFIDRWVSFYRNEKGNLKAGGLRHEEQFKALTADFIIRRTRKQVLPQLPSVVRDYQYYELDGLVQKAYDSGVEKLSEFMDANGGAEGFNFHSELQGHLMILRHITGLAKIEPALEYVDEFLENEDGDEPQKLAIFHHHIDVGNVIEQKLKARDIGYVRIVATQNAGIRDQLLQSLKNNHDLRILIAPTLASGEGIDLDFCSFGILLEREWNPANEEQVEGRFIRATDSMLARIAQTGQKSVNIVYPTAIETVDEYFAEIVERKRQFAGGDNLLNSTGATRWDETEVMKEIARKAIDKWRKKK